VLKEPARQRPVLVLFRSSAKKKRTVVNTMPSSRFE
jgi:hypothetical protein